MVIFFLTLFLFLSSFMQLVVAGEVEPFDAQPVISYAVVYAAADSSLLSAHQLSDAMAVQQLLDREKTSLIARGYAEASLDTLFFAHDTLHVYYHLGIPYVWRELLLDSTLQQHDQEMIRRIMKPEGKHFDPFLIPGHFDRVLSYYANNGYPFATIRFSELFIEEGEVSASLVLEKNPLLVFDSIIVRGDTLLRYPFLQHYLGIYPASVYNQRSVDRASFYLNQLSYARSVAQPQPFFKADNSADVYLFLQKQRANTLDGILGISQKEEGGVLLTGEVNMHIHNIFQMGEELRIVWTKHEEASQYLDVGIVRPYLFASRFGMDASLQLDKIDTLYLNTDMQLGARFYTIGNNYIRLFYEYSASSVIGRFDSLQLLSYQPFTLSKIGLGGRYNLLNNSWNPYRGYYADVSVSYGEKHYPASESLSHYQLFSDVRGYFPLTPRTTIAVKSHTQLKYVERNDDLGYFFTNELFVWGGLNTLRGVDDRSLQSNWFSVFTLEYRFLYDAYSAFYIFGDLAYYERISADGILSDAPVGFGLGTDIQTANGLIKINYALSRQFDNPILLRSGKVHIGFISRF